MSLIIAQALAQKLLTEVLPANGDCWGNVTFDFRRQDGVIVVQPFQWTVREGTPPLFPPLPPQQKKETT